MSELIVRVADLAVGERGDVLVTVGLGSCVAILLHDADAGVGGLAHVLLPAPSLARGGTIKAGKVPQTAIPALVEQMTARGARQVRLSARLVGGASMFAALATPGTIQMGERNIVATRQVLAEARIPIVGEAVGGTFGRTVRFEVGAGRVLVSSVLHGEHEL